jgi:ribonuclease HI
VKKRQRQLKVVADRAPESKRPPDAYDLYVCFDGGCWPNPGGHATWGIVVKNGAREVVMEAKGLVGSGSLMSNNVAEYVAALRALQAIQDLAAPGWRVLLRGDSQIVIDKLRSSKVSKGLCQQACLDAQGLFRQLQDDGYLIDLRWMPREENTEADALTGAAYNFTAA